MVLFTILLIIAIILVIILIVGIIGAGVGFIIAFADVIVCVALIALILRWIWKRCH